MSRRTSKSNKAISAAWSHEQDLVREGKGTRDWTPEQQQDILERGKAHDENGKAFEGHHMKSAEMYPEYQGDPENIQFLSRDEHFDAHGGSFRNATNGYYDYNTRQTTDFGANKYEPCKVIDLSEPISQNSSEMKSERGSKPTESINEQPSEGSNVRGRKPSEAPAETQESNSSSRGEKPQETPTNTVDNSSEQPHTRGVSPSAAEGNPPQTPTSHESAPSNDSPGMNAGNDMVGASQSPTPPEPTQNAIPNTNGIGM